MPKPEEANEPSTGHRHDEIRAAQSDLVIFHFSDALAAVRGHQAVPAGSFHRAVRADALQVEACRQKNGLQRVAHGGEVRQGVVDGSPNRARHLGLGRGQAHATPASARRDRLALWAD